MRARFMTILLACGVILPGAVFFLLHVTGPSDGARLAPGQPVWQVDGIKATPLRPDGLRQGDVVLAIAGQSLESWAQGLFRWDLARPQWRVGQTITYTVLRHGHSLEIPVTLEAYPLGTIVEQEWSTILYAPFFLLVAVFVFVLRPDERAARVQLLMASSMVGATTWSFGLQVSDLVNGLGFWLFIWTTLGIYLLFWSSLLHFALTFPRPQAITVKWRFVVPLVYTLPFACALLLIVSGWYLASSTLDWIGHWSLTETIFSVIYSVLALLLVFWTYRTARDRTERQKIAWIVYAGFISVAGGLLLWQAPGLLGYSILSSNALGLLVLPYPFALAIAILRYHLFDIDLLIKRTLVYGILIASVVGICSRKTLLTSIPSSVN